VNGVRLTDPIEGIRLTDAKDTYFDGPESRDDLMFTAREIGSSVSCRILVRTTYDGSHCYSTCLISSTDASCTATIDRHVLPVCPNSLVVKPDCQIVTKNHRRERVPITKKKLAFEVAKRVEAYLEELEVSAQTKLRESVLIPRSGSRNPLPYPLRRHVSHQT
jgi:hypothetical protein